MTQYMDRAGKLYSPRENAKVRSRSGVFAACVSKGKILMTWPTEDLVELPGGGIDPGEDIAVAVLRELYEETAVTCPPVQPAKEFKQHAHYYSIDNDEYWNYDQTFWLIDDPKLEALIFDGETAPVDALKARWVPLADLKNMPLHAVHRAALKSFGLWSEK